ncbi:MAG: hypothetical protein VYE62_11675, partial [Pseudomonadota bacterium]|nr:hypothetical protein [Pseudomonadota bacterium]
INPVIFPVQMGGKTAKTRLYKITLSWHESCTWKRREIVFRLITDFTRMQVSYEKDRGYHQAI